MAAPNYGKPSYRYGLSRKRFRSYGATQVATRFRQGYVFGVPAGTWTFPYDPVYNGDECCYDHLHRGPPFLSGGPLSLHRSNKNVNPKPFVGIGNAFHEDSGELYIDWDPGYDPLVACGSVTPASDFGAQAWNRFKPGKPALNLAVTLAELRQAPQLIFKRLRSMKDIGNNYLAYSFGWRPLARDIRALVTLQRTISSRVSQLRRDNGKGVRRGGMLWSNSTTVFDRLTGTLAKAKIKGCDNFQDILLPLTVSRQTIVNESVWFSARFRYYIPDIEEGNWEDGAIRKLYGASLTPAVAWELIPWSWMIDWFSNVGDVVANMDSGAVDNLVADYAFVMHSRERTTIVSSDVSLSRHLGGVERIFAQSTYSLVEKYRAPAHPYGFNASWETLSLSQSAILLALGIARGY